MKYLQIMPPEESFFQPDMGLIIAISVILIMVIVLFDRSKLLSSLFARKK